jgi:hypothetical protein
VVVLTRDRPEILRRCLGEALRGLGPQDRLTILDDSTAVRKWRASGEDFIPHDRGTTLFHLATRELESMVRELGRAAPTWLLRAAPRDIAPLRNMSLLLSVAIPADTTLLIDDDVCQIDPLGLHHRVDSLADSEAGLIVGAPMTGISELDTITRLLHALDVLAASGVEADPEFTRRLFQAPPAPPSTHPAACRYVSAGYLAFRLAPEKLFAFPPGYNEDWLWCLLHRNQGVRVIRSSESVAHEPPVLRQPTRQDLWFELQGDLVLDCLDAQQPGPAETPLGMLTRLAARPPDREWMPAVRTEELFDKTHSTGLCDRAEFLGPYGTTVLGEMLRQGELDWNGAELITSWSGDAVAKHNTFAAALRDESLIAQTRTFIDDRRL